MDKNRTAVAAVATVFPDMPDSGDAVWEITAEEAEEIIRKQMAEDKAKVLAGRTHQTLLPIAGRNETYLPGLSIPTIPGNGRTRLMLPIT